MSDTGPTTTTPFSVGASLQPAAGEQKITRDEAAKLIAQRLRLAAPTIKAQAETANDKGGVAGAAQGVGQLLGALGDAANSPLSPVGAVELPYKKAYEFITGGDKAGPDAFDALGKKMADLLPEEALYPSVLNNVDQRQLLARFMAGDTQQPTTLGSVTFSPAERTLAGAVFAVQQDNERTAATALAGQAGITGDAEVKKYVDDTVGAYRGTGTELAASPTAVLTAASAPTTPGQTGPTGLAAAASSSSFAEGLSGLTSGAHGKTPFLTNADVQQMFRLASTDLSAVNQYENSLATYRANVNQDFTDPYRVDVGAVPGQYPMASGAGEAARNTANYTGAVKGTRGYSLTEAKDLLYSMSKDEVTKIQNLLLRAGYFADSSGRSNTPLMTGDPTDELTQAGWLKLIGDSIRTGAPVYDTLSKRALDAGTKFADATGKAASDVILSDSAAINSSADSLSVKEIGRKLSDAEHAQLVQFIHGLESKAQNTTNQPGSQTVEQPDVGAEIEQYLNQTFQTESQGKDAADQYNTFTQLLAGPGGR